MININHDRKVCIRALISSMQEQECSNYIIAMTLIKEAFHFMENQNFTEEQIENIFEKALVFDKNKNNYDEFFESFTYTG